MSLPVLRAARPPAGGPADPRCPAGPGTSCRPCSGLVAVIVVIAIVAGVWTDFLWFRSVHYASVFGVTYGTRWALFFVTGLFMALVVGGLNAGARLPAAAGLPARPRPQRPGMEAYRLAVDPHRRLLLGVVLGIVGLISGLSAASAWRTWLLFANQVPFGRTDPQFHLDISFFVFTYPFIRLVLAYLFAAVLLVAGGGRRWCTRCTAGCGMQGRAAAGDHGRAGAPVRAGWAPSSCSRPSPTGSTGTASTSPSAGRCTTGASYTDVNAVLPAKTVLAVIALLCAAAVLRRRGPAQRDAARRSASACSCCRRS